MGVVRATDSQWTGDWMGTLRQSGSCGDKKSCAAGNWTRAVQPAACRYTNWAKGERLTAMDWIEMSHNMDRWIISCIRTATTERYFKLESTGLWKRHIITITTILDIIYRPAFYLEHNVTETRFCLRPPTVPTRVGPRIQSPSCFK
jgi:hypothetical protein